jgi:Lipocalin-like domain
MISRPDIPKFAVNNVNQGTAEENKAVVNGITAHFGTWSVDGATKTITTNVKASSFPNLNGGRQKRVISSLAPDELKYTNPLSTTGATGT